MWHHTQAGYFMNISLPFSLRWAVACCWRFTNLIINELARQQVVVVCYINDFTGVAGTLKQQTSKGIAQHLHPPRSDVHMAWLPLWHQAHSLLKMSFVSGPVVITELLTNALKDMLSGLSMDPSLYSFYMYSLCTGVDILDVKGHSNLSIETFYDYIRAPFVTQPSSGSPVHIWGFTFPAVAPYHTVCTFIDFLINDCTHV